MSKRKANQAGHRRLTSSRCSIPPGRRLKAERPNSLSACSCRRHPEARDWKKGLTVGGYEVYFMRSTASISFGHQGMGGLTSCRYRLYEDIWSNIKGLVWNVVHIGGESLLVPPTSAVPINRFPITTW